MSMIPKSGHRFSDKIMLEHMSMHPNSAHPFPDNERTPPWRCRH